MFAGFDAVPALFVKLKLGGYDTTAFIDTGFVSN